MKVKFLRAWGPFAQDSIVDLSPLTVKKLTDKGIVEEFKEEKIEKPFTKKRKSQSIKNLARSRAKEV